MFEGALAYLGFQFAKFQFRSEVDQVQPFSEFLQRARNVLIMMPTGYEEAILAGDALRAFRDQLNHLQITIVHNSTRATSLAEFQHSEVIRLDPSDLNKFSLPTRVLLQRVFHREYDVAMDLNLDFVLHTAYICRASHAKVRVGFAHPASEMFFNVQVNVDRKATPQAIYKRFATCLAMF
ncbi:MAG: hypothetical protein HYR76_07775 [Ignavibacteria bacterium]|nr:hypothetical protein [Ignavibacteria bacterium]